MNLEGGFSNQRIHARLARLGGCMARLTRPLLDSEPDISSLVQIAFGSEALLTKPDTILLPVKRFFNESEASSIWEQVADTLSEQGIGPSNTWSDVDGIFAELVLNAAQHSFSDMGCTATLECSIIERETVFTVGVADAGIGILSSLRRNPRLTGLTSDEAAISRATELGVSGTTEQRGVGLHFVVERVSAYSGELLIVSGSGMMLIRGGQGIILQNLQKFTPATSTRFDGTVVMVALPIPPL